MAISARKPSEPRVVSHPTLQRTASARWSGPLKEGRGMLSTGSGSLAGASYSFSTRFESTRGTNPEELLAAAHAACFAMAFAHELTLSGHVPDRIDAEARLSLHSGEDGWSIVGIHLVARGIVPGCDNERFTEIAHHAKEHCPVSRLFNAPITLETELQRPQIGQR